MFSPQDSSIPTSASGKRAMLVAVEAARRAGLLLVNQFHSEKDVRFKGRGNVITNMDKTSEKAVLDLLKLEYPDFGIISEESDPLISHSPYTWVVDPLDGSRNYASELPHYAIMIALLNDTNVVLGVTYDPVRKEMFTAEYGKGAHLNGFPISVSDHTQLLDCVLGFDLGYFDQGGANSLEVASTLWPGLQAVRAMGSGALGLAYAACGRCDIYFHPSLYPWDLASGLLLVSEAGGIVVDRKGSPANLNSLSVIASNPTLVEHFLSATDGLSWRTGLITTQ